MKDNRDQHELFWEQQMYNYQDLKEEITEKVTNDTNKLIDNIENRFGQINEIIERKQEEAIEMVFDKLERTIDNMNRQNNLRSETEIQIMTEIRTLILYTIQIVETIDNQKTILEDQTQ